MIKNLDRRDTLKLTGFLFASSLVALPTPTDAKMWKADYDGNYYPVSPRHTAEIDSAFGPSWPHLEHSEQIRLALMALSENRHLTKEEKSQVIAADHIRNMNSAIKHLKGRDFRPMFQYIDQVHGNKTTAPCECELVYLFDHHLRTEPDKIVHYPHYPWHICDDHIHLHNDWETHFHTVMTESKARINRQSEITYGG